MSKFKIGWNDGHTLSGKGTGAAKIIKETDRNRKIGALAKKYLLEYEGVEIVNCTIDKSENDMYEAVTRANNANCDLFVSNHVNAGGGAGKGFESFYSRKSTASNIAKAKIIHKHLVATKSCLLNRRCCDDYSYKGYDLYVLINTKMDAILCEIGFVDNQECVDAVNDDEVARAYANGIAEAYGLKKKSTPTNTSSTATNTATTSELYRVRKTWADVASQKGAYTVLDSAKKNCPTGYSVFDSKANKVYPAVVNSTTTQNTNIKEEIKVDYIIQYSNSTDQAIAEVMADRLNCPTINCLRPYAYYKNYKTVIAVGEAKNKSGYTNVEIKGSNRADTLKRAIAYCEKLGR